MVVALGSLASEQYKFTESTWYYIVWFLNYAATNPDATICYENSDIILYISSDESYLLETIARSRVGGISYLSNKPSNKIQVTNLDHPCNALVHGVVRILKMITSSTMEIEVAAIFYNTKDGLLIRAALEKLGHPQPPTPIEADNENAIGFLDDSMKQKHSNAIDMRFYWVKDRIGQK